MAAGRGHAIRAVYGAIHEGNPTPDLLAIKYLEALQGIANGRATKIFVPADMSAALGSIGGIAELFRGDRSPLADGPDDDAFDDSDGGAVEARRAAVPARSVPAASPTPTRPSATSLGSWATQASQTQPPRPTPSPPAVPRMPAPQGPAPQTPPPPAFPQAPAPGEMSAADSMSARSGSGDALSDLFRELGS